MAYTALKLISKAHYLSGVVSREFEAVSDTQVADGLDSLNDLLGDMEVEQRLIPYYTSYDLTAVVGQEEYTIANLVDIETVTFTKNTVRYSLTRKKRDEYFGSPRANNISSLPFQWHFERQLAGGKLFLYFQPDVAYPVEIWGLFKLSEVTINQDLALTVARFYINYLKYALADRICQEYNIDTPSNVMKELARYEKRISKNSASIDLRMQKIGMFNGIPNVNYAYANLGTGFLP